jgi:hypothetical protein
VLIKSLSALGDTYDAKVKAKMAEEFATMALAKGKRPINFIGVSSKAEASCELRRRASNNPLTSEEISLLEAADVPVAQDVIREEIPERYFFNPEIVADATLAAKISAALSSIPELAGQEIIIRQPMQEALYKTIVGDDALDAVGATKDLELIKELLPIVSSLSIRVKLTTANLNEAFTVLKSAEIVL